MPRRVSKDLFTKIKAEYEALTKEGPKNINDSFDTFINFKYDAFKQSGAMSIENSEKLDNQAKMFALYIFASNNSKDPQMPRTMMGNLIDEFEFRRKTIEAAEKAFNDPSLKMDEFVEIDIKGETVLNTQAYKDKKEAEKEAAKNFSKEQTKMYDEIREKEKQEKENKQREEEYKAKQEANKLYSDIDKTVPKYDEFAPKEEEVKYEAPLKDVISSESIKGFLDMADAVYSNTQSKSHIGDNKNAFFTDFDDEKIKNAINREHLYPAAGQEFSLAEAIDSITLYNKQQEKLKSFGFLKNLFGFLFDDVKEVRASIKAIEDKYSEHITPEDFKKLATNKDKHVVLKNMVDKDLIFVGSIENEMFNNPDNKTKDYLYARTYYHTIETNDVQIHLYKSEEEEKLNEFLKEQETLVGKQIALEDNAFEEKENEAIINSNNEKQKEISKEKEVEEISV